ncbi:MAG: helix-turn-helix domain-containing protein [Actinobacteria bacterium]|nr:helix-turn-helix domain-containing protein [Actinomycetota bacterium]MBU1942921.1 helix-turn-helix domain-containing protein [Actinomycetota bacterium]MBU2687652.1 helix-turn-helix domain-containing protein [Actinomycetota bacterium]
MELKMRAIRESRGWTLTDLTVVTRIPEPTLSAMERCKIPAYPKYRQLLSRAFGLPEAELFEEADE